MDSKMDKWIHASVPKGFRALELPSFSAEKGGARLALLESLAGTAGLKAAREAGAYLLEDKLALELKLKGLSVPKNGEVAALSPARWERGVSTTEIPEEAAGLVLEAAAARRFRAFLKSLAAPRATKDPAGVIALARHFFYEEAVKILVPTRTPV